MPTTNMCDSCVAYRHLLKEVARTEEGREMRLAATRALDEPSLQKLGKLMHQIVKFGVQVARAKSIEEHEMAMKSLREHVAMLPQDGAVLKSWELKG